MAFERNRLGIVYPVLFAGPGNTNSNFRGEARREYVKRTLQWVIDDPQFVTVEISRIKNSATRKEAASMLKAARKSGAVEEVVWCAQLVQLINEDGIVPASDISSLDEYDRVKAVDRLKECIDEACEYGAEKFTFFSGKDPAIMQGLSGEAAERVRGEAMVQLRRSLHEICLYLKQQNKKHKSDCVPLLIPFDARVNPPGVTPFKEMLIGPADRAEAIIESVRHHYGHEELGLLIDTSHAIINGEGPDTLKRIGAYVKHIHVSNCILNRNNPDGDLRYGDVHPAFNLPDSELTSPVLAGYLQALAECGFEGSFAFEIKPQDHEIPEDLTGAAKSLFYGACNRIEVNYAPRLNYIYQSRKFLSEGVWDQLCELRIHKKSIIKERMLKRKQRKQLASNGRMVILAADHPARMVTHDGRNPVGMGDRFDYLGRCARVMMASRVDGLMATADIIEDLVLLDYLQQEKTGKSFLDERVLIACMNRSGLSGARYELLDRNTAYRDAKKIKELKLDGAKMLMRLAVPDPYDRYALQTMEECSRSIEICNEIDLPVFLEPLPVKQIDGQYKVLMNADDLIRIIGVASGLSHSTANLWLKIPYVDNYWRVAQSFSGPILMLGGASTGNPIDVIEQFVRGMGEGENVRGAMVGRNVLYPGGDDPAAVAEAVCALVHEGVSANDAVKRIQPMRGAKMDLLKV
ncbi:MAG: TIM barrel protein [bacterium]|nr:TIM barrel protein [bacterium]